MPPLWRVSNGNCLHIYSATLRYILFSFCTCRLLHSAADVLSWTCFLLLTLPITWRHSIITAIRKDSEKSYLIKDWCASYEASKLLQRLGRSYKIKFFL